MGHHAKPGRAPIPPTMRPCRSHLHTALLHRWNLRSAARGAETCTVPSRCFVQGCATRLAGVGPHLFRCALQAQSLVIERPPDAQSALGVQCRTSAFSATARTAVGRLQGSGRGPARRALRLGKCPAWTRRRIGCMTCSALLRDTQAYNASVLRQVPGSRSTQAVKMQATANSGQKRPAMGPSAHAVRRPRQPIGGGLVGGGLVM